MTAKLQSGPTPPPEVPPPIASAEVESLLAKALKVLDTPSTRRLCDDVRRAPVEDQVERARLLTVWFRRNLANQPLQKLLGCRRCGGRCESWLVSTCRSCREKEEQ